MRSAWRSPRSCWRPSSTGPASTIVDHHTYVFIGDGCLMEGISHEACSLAGTLGLGKLIVFYDDNGISIDGQVEGWFTDDTPKRFEAYGWNVIRDVDGHDVAAVDAAIAAGARQSATSRRLICCKTVIGKGAPNKAGTAQGARRGARATRKSPRRAKRSAGRIRPFEIPADVYAAVGPRKAQGAAASKASGTTLFAAYARAISAGSRAEFKRRMAGELPADFDARSRCGTSQRANAKRRNHRDAQGRQQRASRRWRRCCRNCSAARPT